MKLQVAIDYLDNYFDESSMVGEAVRDLLDYIQASRELVKSARSLLALVEGECGSIIEDDHNVTAVIEALSNIKKLED